MNVRVTSACPSACPHRCCIVRYVAKCQGGCGDSSCHLAARAPHSTLPCVGSYLYLAAPDVEHLPGPQARLALLEKLDQRPLKLRPKDDQEPIIRWVLL